MLRLRRGDVGCTWPRSCLPGTPTMTPSWSSLERSTVLSGAPSWRGTEGTESPTLTIVTVDVCVVGSLLGLVLWCRESGRGALAMAGAWFFYLCHLINGNRTLMADEESSRSRSRSRIANCLSGYKLKSGTRSAGGSCRHDAVLPGPIISSCPLKI